MKLILPIALGLVCLGLAIAFFVTKQGDNAQHQTDVAAIIDYSNRWDTAQALGVAQQGTLATLSNNLAECHSGLTTFSNQLAEAKAETASNMGEITNLNARISSLQTENGEFFGRLTAFTNQMDNLTQQLAATKTSLTATNDALTQAQKDYLLLENRFRIDVGERTVVERKFRNPAALKAQLQKLKQQPAEQVSAESIYAGLDVEVKSNGTFHVIAPN